MADQFRDAGHHAEPYADLFELLDRSPSDGLILVTYDLLEQGDGELVEYFRNEGVSLPLIAAATNPSLGEIVSALEAGAFDFVKLPLCTEEIERIVAHVRKTGGEHHKIERLRVAAKKRIDELTEREYEVLELMAKGCSNKAIARELEISPRTVEIHRANVMKKLEATHVINATAQWYAASRLNVERLFEDSLD